MREAIFILLILLALIGWTVFRYRKQIMSLIGFGKMIRDVASGRLPHENTVNKAPGTVQLARCSVCGVNVPTGSLRRLGDGSLICDKH
jgi:hypothetical protein